MKDKNKDKYVLILGANSDIAKALAYRLAEDGYNLQLAARDRKPLAKIIADLNIRYDKSVEFYQYDAADINNISVFLEKLSPRPQVVIMAVGLLYQQKELENNGIIDTQKANDLYVTNFLGPSLILEHFAAELSKSKNKTAIIAISSVAGDRGRAKNYWYGASKAALSVFLSGLRQKYSDTNLLIMTVKPGFVATKMLKGEQTPKLLTATPDETAQMIISGMKKNKAVVYNWKWRIIMIVIKLLPERIFKKMRF